MTFFWSETGSGFGEPGGTPTPQEFLEVPPPGVALKGTVKWATETCNLFCNIAAKRVENRCCAFYTHIKPILQQIRFLTGLNEVGQLKRATLLFNSFAAMLH